MSATPLGRNRRLVGGAIFQALLRKGRRRSYGALSARMLPGGDARDGTGRLGLSIAKRHVRKSVDRNRLKRMVREAYRLRGNRLDGMDILFLLDESGKAREEVKRLPAALRTVAGRRQLRSTVGAILDLAEIERDVSSTVGDKVSS